MDIKKFEASYWYVYIESLEVLDKKLQKWQKHNL